MYIDSEIFYRRPYKRIGISRICLLDDCEGRPIGNLFSYAEKSCKDHSAKACVNLAALREIANSVEDNPPPERLRLGSVTFHTKSARLVQENGHDVILRRQSAQVLEFLVRHVGEIVSRDALIDEVWPDISVTEDSLTQCVSDIRRALGDHDHTILKTVRNRGYLLRGEPISDRSQRAPALPVQEPPQNATDCSIAARLDPRDVLPTLAIMPMRPLSSDPADPIGFFVADEISNALSQSQDANVISRLSTVSVKNTDWDLREIGRRLNADFVLSGFWVTEADGVILSVELSDAENGFVLWSDRMRFGLDELLGKTDWADGIVHHVRSAIMLNETRRLRSYPLEDLKLFSVLHGAIGLMHRFSTKDFYAAKAHLEYVAESAASSPVPLAWLAPVSWVVRVGSPPDAVRTLLRA